MSEPERISRDGQAADGARRRRLAAALGSALPEETADDRSDGWGERPVDASADEWLRREVPPHHG